MGDVHVCVYVCIFGGTPNLSLEFAFLNTKDINQIRQKAKV